MSLIYLHYLEMPGPHCLCTQDQALAYAHPSSFCWGITALTAHRPMSQSYALTCPPEPHPAHLTTPCRCLNSMCLKPNTVPFILFPHQVCLHHCPSMLNLFVFVFLTGEFQGQILWLEHIGPGLQAITNELKSNL